MARGDAKVDLRPIIAAHYGSLLDANTGRRRLQDHLWLEGPPLCVAAGSVLLQVRLDEAADGLLTANGLLGAFLFGAMLQVSGRAMTWAESKPPHGPETSEEAIFFGELTANAGYAAIVAVTTAVAFVGASASSSAGNWLVAWSALGLALGTHLVLTLFMVLKRVYAITERRLIVARTSPSEEPEPPPIPQPDPAGHVPQGNAPSSPSPSRLPMTAGEVRRAGTVRPSGRRARTLRRPPA